MDLSKLTSDQLNKMVNDTKGTKKSRASARAEINRRVSEKQRKLGRGILTKAKDIIVPKTKAKEQSNIARGKKRKRKVISMQERARKAKARKRGDAEKAEHQEEKAIEKIQWQNRSRIRPLRKVVDEE